MLSYSILVCALNEEANIGGLLSDILTIQTMEGVELRRVLVVSDGSTDGTNNIIQDFVGRFPLINLKINQHRQGKMVCMIDAFSRLDEDFVVSLDADVRLAPGAIETLVKKIASRSDTRLFAGNPVPEEVRNKTFAQRAAWFSWLLLNEIKKMYPSSIYSAHGRILALSKSLYKDFSVSDEKSVGTDQLMYIAANHSFEYVTDAVVFYKNPRTTADFIKQNKRFRLAKKSRTNDKLIEKSSFRIPNRLRITIFVGLRHPAAAFCWLTLYFIGFLAFQLDPQMRKKNASEYAWSEVRSSK